MVVVRVENCAYIYIYPKSELYILYIYITYLAHMLKKMLLYIHIYYIHIITVKSKIYDLMTRD